MTAPLTKTDLFGFADFYHRYYATGLTMDEMLVNYRRYTKDPRDIKDNIKAPGKVKAEQINVKPKWGVMHKLLRKACEVRGTDPPYIKITPGRVSSKARDRELVDVRQWVSYVGIMIGFEPPDFLRILKWDRTSIYNRSNKCIELASTDKTYRQSLNIILEAFGEDEFIA